MMLDKFRYSYIILFAISLLLSKAMTDVLASVLSLIFLLYTFFGKHENRWEWANALWFKAGLLFLGWMVLRTAWAEPFSEEVLKAFLFVRFLIFPAALVGLVFVEQKYVDFCLKALLAFAVLLSIDVIFQWIVGVDILGKTSISDGRLSGPYNFPRAGIMLMYVAMPLFAYLLYAPKKWILPAIVAATLIPFAIFLSGDRTPFLLLIIGLCGLVCVSQKQYRFMGAAILAGIAAIMAVFAVFHFSGEQGGSTILQRQVASTYDTIKHFGESPYGQIWQQSVHMSAKEPVFGHGRDQYQNFCLSTFGDSGLCQGHPHNIFLEVWFEYGALGVALFSFFCIVLLVRTYMLHVPNTHQFLARAFFVLLCLRLFPLATVPSFFSSMSAVPFWFMFGLALALEQRKKA